MRAYFHCRRGALILAWLLALGACATLSNNYSYVRQADSASVSGSQYSSLDPASAAIFIDSIDKSLIGAASGSDTPIYLSPGAHNLALNAQASEEFYEFSEGFLTVEREFVASHAYRFTATFLGLAGVFDVTLWDETGGAEKPVSLQTWVVQGQSTAAAEHDFIVYEDLGAGEFSRPPMEAGGGYSSHEGDNRSRESHLPPIPHDRRPGGGERGGHEGGGHGGGGGGGRGGGGGGGGGGGRK